MTQEKIISPAVKTASEKANFEQSEQLLAIKKIIDKHKGKPGALLAILEEAQQTDASKHLSQSVLWYIATELGESPSRVYSVATFYANYSLKPQGKHVITVCRGTACHTRGSHGILSEVIANLGISDYKEDEEAFFTSSDGLFTVRTIACFGQCALAPVVSIDGKIFSRVTSKKLGSIITSLSKGRKK